MGGRQRTPLLARKTRPPGSREARQGPRVQTLSRRAGRCAGRRGSGGAQQRAGVCIGGVHRGHASGCASEVCAGDVRMKVRIAT